MNRYRSATLAGWVTNDPMAAIALRNADIAYFAAREVVAASNLNLADKVSLLRKAHTDRDAAYDKVRSLCTEG